LLSATGLWVGVALPEGGRTQLPERAVLDLADAFGAHSELGRDVSQALRRTGQTKARAHDGALAVAEATEQVAQFAGGDPGDDPLVLVLGERVCDQLAEGAEGALLAFQRLLERLGRAVGSDQVRKLIFLLVR
jgi:hypothetical protein